MPIRDPAEDESSYDRAHDVEGSNGSKVGAGKMERFGALQGRAERADDGDFEPVKNPGDPQSDDDQKGETGSTEAGRGEMGCWSGSWVEKAASASLNYFRLPLGRRHGLAEAT